MCAFIISGLRPLHFISWRFSFSTSPRRTSSSSLFPLSLSVSFEGSLLLSLQCLALVWFLTIVLARAVPVSSPFREVPQFVRGNSYHHRYRRLVAGTLFVIQK